MWKNLRILLLGEPRVGKTSLILSLVSEEFSEEVPSKADEVIIPADVTPEKIPTHIVDYSSSEQNISRLYEELSLANVVCLVYDLSDAKSLIEIQNTWLPFIRENSLSPMPVVLVGNKSDLMTCPDTDRIVEIMNDHCEVEASIECSAKTLKNICEMFYFAQKAILHPTGPLYCAHSQMLKEGCMVALARVFCLCDMDKDGLLSDEELNIFQKVCFNAPLTDQALQNVKTIVGKSCQAGVRNGMLTLDGFINLHLLFIQRGRNETTWTVLRKFGYSNSLELADQYLHPPIQQPPADTVCQLTNDAHRFLKDVFHAHDKDHDGYLNEQEVCTLFSLFPYDPWGADVTSVVHTNEKGWISLRGFLSQWAMTAYFDLPRAVEYMAYLGYSTLTGNHSQADATECIPLQLRSGKQNNLQAQKRNIYICQVIGPRGVGKTAFLQGLLERQTLSNKTSSAFAINTVSVQSRTKYLLLHEVNSSELMESLGEGSTVYDIVCLLFDSSDPGSFQECLALYKRCFKRINTPCLVIATKTDVAVAQQHGTVQPVDFCKSLGIPPPLKYSFHCKENSSGNVFQLVTSYAVHHRSFGSAKSFRTAIKFCLATAALGAVGYMLYKNLLLQKPQM